MPALSAKERKRKEREKEKTLGVTKVFTKLSMKQIKKLDDLCAAFGDKNSDYTRDEMLSTFVDLAHAQLQEQPKCKHCNLQLPKGCNGNKKVNLNVPCEKKYLRNYPLKLM